MITRILSLSFPLSLCVPSVVSSPDAVTFRRVRVFWPNGLGGLLCAVSCGFAQESELVITSSQEVDPQSQAAVRQPGWLEGQPVPAGVRFMGQGEFLVVECFLPSALVLNRWIRLGHPEAVFVVGMPFNETHLCCLAGGPGCSMSTTTRELLVAVWFLPNFIGLAFLPNPHFPKRMLTHRRAIVRVLDRWHLGCTQLSPCSRAILPNAELWIAGDSELQLEATRVSIDVRTMAVSTGSSVTLQYASAVLGQLHWAGCLRVQRVCL